MKHRKSIFTYILINIIVSALTTLVVLIIWNLVNRPVSIPDGSSQSITIPNPSVTSLPNCPIGLETLPDLDEAVIEIKNVFGNGDINNEYIEISRVGEMDLCITGWKVTTSSGYEYVFPNLVLNKNARILLYSRNGSDTPDKLFWGLDGAVWKAGDTVKLLDREGNLRASYEIP